MDCFVCATRSAVESCSQCQALLCELCSIKCDQCGKVVCPEHSHKTHSGKLLCMPCQQKRKARKAQMKAAAEHRLDDDLPALHDEEGEDPEAHVLTASVKKTMAPWEISAYIGGLGLALMLVVLIFSGWRRFPLPWGGFFYTPLFFMLVPLMAVFWSVIGLKKEEYADDRPRCYVGLGMAVLACILGILAVFTDPARRLELEAERVDAQRKDMTVEQVQRTTQQKLQRFTPPPARSNQD